MVETVPDVNAPEVVKADPNLEERILPKSIKLLLYGVSGTGKSVVAATLGNVPEIKNIFFIAVESNAVVGLHKGLELHNISPENRKKFHVLRIDPGKRSVADLLSSVRTVLSSTPKVLAESHDPRRGKYTRFTEIVKGMQTFIDENGTDHGTITDWGEDTVVYIDGLTVAMEAIKQTIIGGKVVLSLPSRGIMQEMLMQYVRFLTEEVRCHVVMLGHPVRQVSDITRTENIFIASGGQALKDTLPSAFTDVIYASKVSKNYYWNSTHLSAITSARNITEGERMKPDFTLFDWKPKSYKL